MRNAIVVFTKVPKAGETKTRLTTQRGGVLTPEEAQSFYEACLLDVINSCTAARSGDVWICYNSDGDRDYLDELLTGVAEPEKIKGIYCDHGGTFDECMQYAADYILKKDDENRLADGVVIVGGDLPGLQPAIVRQAVNKLTRLALSSNSLVAAKKADEEVGAAVVEGACQEGGFSIIGYTYTTPFNFERVFYNQEGITALDMVVDKAEAGKIPFAFVEMVPDVDIPVDLASMIPVVKGIQLAACYDKEVLMPVNIIKMLEELGLGASAPPPRR
ncbi:MAG: hypothetical protein H6Q73_329 [Firmicutes bacterium]|nr:hypothetical protein [Bacillota bacterium]